MLSGDTREYQNIQMVVYPIQVGGRCDAVVKKSDSDPGDMSRVLAVLAVPLQMPTALALATFKCLSDNDIGGGLAGRVSDEVPDAKIKTQNAARHRPTR